jgi:methylenetetrahydrofolate reductase (NADPH)
MKFAEAYRDGKFGLSFELFPPKSPAGEEALWRNLDDLVSHRPNFITCTYGAMGSTRDKTLEIVSEVRRRYGLPVASHLTCVGSTVEQLGGYLERARERGVDNIVALRGDPPKGETSFTPVAGGLRYANELVALIHRQFPEFGVAVAGYPETHQEAPNAEADLANLKRKVDAGADVVITQVYYDNTDFFRFRQRCEVLGIRVPIIPGILPVTNCAQVKRITSMCKARIPDPFLADLEAAGDDENAQFEVGVEYAKRQVSQLLAEGVAGIHFYVMNKSPATMRILQSVDLPARA